MADTYTMAEIIGITGLSERTIRRYIKKGKLMADTLPAHGRQGKKTAIAISKLELDRFLNEQKHTMADTLPAPDRRHAGTMPDIKEIVKEAIQEEQSAIMKPLEQQALYRLGRVEQENEFLREQNETLRIENDQLRENMKALPVEDITPIREENEKLKKQLSILPAEPVEVNKILMQNADNFKALQEKLNILPAEPEKVNEILKLGVEKFKALEDNFIKQSGEKEYLEAELKKLQQEAEEMRQKLSRPWWKIW